MYPFARHIPSNPRQKATVKVKDPLTKQIIYLLVLPTCSCQYVLLTEVEFLIRVDTTAIF